MQYPSNGLRAVLALFSLAVVGCSYEPSPDAIDRVLAWDRQMYEQYERERRQGSPRREAMIRMVGHMKNIDTSACPTEFREAYLEHCQAWEKFAATTNSDNGIGALMALISAAGGDYLGAATSLTSIQAGPDASAVLESWHEVELVAIRHGAMAGQGDGRHQ